ncbi:hypothetical protein RRG08_048786 [Elysia crispata]|uniref:Uncharacterized protein n=1 Tax=Elysia crispata TaxID=231223 RepID=A0AAE1APY5_9GAST|nr:hypothetical protein RRG08_048786 [Elysia crispata]
MAKKDETIYTNPNSKQRATSDEGSDAEEASNGPEGLAGILSRFADKCSVSGMPFITQAENAVVRIIWSCLLIAAFALMSFHLYNLIITYFQYKKQTQVQLSFNNLQFPAVTICNENAMRMSQIYLASQNLKQFIDDVDPAAVGGLLDQWQPELEDNEDDQQTSPSGLKRKRKRRQAESPKKDTRQEKNNKNSSSGSSSQGGKKLRRNNFFDDLDSGQKDTVEEAIDEYFMNNEKKTWEAEGRPSGLYKLEQKFLRHLCNEPSSVRSQMGHQIHNMLLQCSFAGRKCIARNFTRSLTSQYGNCYTLQYPKFVSRESGPSDGLQLRLFLETDDYVPGISTSKGIQVVIHDQGTISFPEDEGLAVSAGTETFIGLRRLEVSRLGSPYDKCTPTEEFQEKYGIKYTRKACQRVCRQQRMRQKCGCYDIMQQEVERVLKRPRNLQPCQSKKEIQCALKIATNFQKDNDICDCHRPCKETTFEKTVSFRSWPNPALAGLMSSAACKQNTPVCSTLPGKSGYELREEFVKLVIYYEDLNYEELTESPDYELDQFLSDVGGTIGLWIGLSLLSLFEIIHLITDICLYICCAGRRQR